MPYIIQEQKDWLETGGTINTPGNLNYLITQLLIRYWTNSPRNYQAINDVVGAIEGAKLEFVRRVVNPYEDEKIRSNGDLYQ